jgi:hypothetical protein
MGIPISQLPPSVQVVAARRVNAIIFAIDPGPTQSAALVLKFDGAGVPNVGEFGIYDNAVLLDRIHNLLPGSMPCAIEMVASFGMAVGAEVFETVYWIGRYAEAYEQAGGKVYRVYRKDVKMNLCHSMRAKDPNIRQAIIDQFGGKDLAIGKKASPGPLYGIKADLWSALAVGLTWLDTRQ